MTLFRPLTRTAVPGTEEFITFIEHLSYAEFAPLF